MRETSHDDASGPTVEEMLSTRLSISSVKIVGAKRTSSKLLDRITLPTLSTGGTFASVVDDVSQAVDLLRATNCFRGVDAYLDTASSDVGASAVFTLSEKSLYQLHTGTTVDASPGHRHDPTLEGSFIWRNLSGQADTLKASVSWLGGAAGEALASQPSSSAQISYRRPFALGLRTGLFASMSSSLHNHEQKSSHCLALKSAQMGIDHTLGRLSVLASWRHLLDVQDRASPLVRDDAGHSWKTSVRQVIEIDRRDSRRMPTEGDCVSITAEATIPPGDIRFSKIEAGYQAHLPIGTSGLSACISANSGVLVSQQRTNVIDRFFLGGVSSFRGFDERGVGPRDQNDAVGGDFCYSGTAMLSIPVPENSLLSQVFNARMHLFGTVGDLTDVPSIRSSVQKLAENGTAADRLRAVWKELHSSMRIAVGLGMAFETAVGRVELNFCKILRSATSDSASAGFQFGIGESFS